MTNVTRKSIVEMKQTYAVSRRDARIYTASVTYGIRGIKAVNTYVTVVANTRPKSGTICSRKMTSGREQYSFIIRSHGIIGVELGLWGFVRAIAISHAHFHFFIPFFSVAYLGGPCASPPPLWPDRRDFCNYFGIILAPFRDKIAATSDRCVFWLKML